MRRAAKVDANAPAIEGALREVGAAVQSLARLGQGCPDALVSYKGVNFLFEWKNPDGKDEVNEAQRKWHIAWNAPVYVVRTPDEALKVIGAIA
ncbi:MAG TPA: hypothetical protein VF786_03990 [Terriglobales bacterium]